MICPYCEHENIDGVDCCEDCQQDLTIYDKPRGRSAIERKIMKAPLARLRPKPPVMVAEDATVAAAIELLCAHNIGCVLVGSADDVKGIFSERDVLLRVIDRYDEVANQPVSAFMTPRPSRLDVDAPIAYALNRMSNGDFRHLPITRDKKIIGIVSLRDILSFLSEWYPDLIPPQDTRRRKRKESGTERQEHRLSG